MNKIFLKVVSVIALSAFVLSGCGKQKEETKSTPKPTATSEVVNKDSMNESFKSIMLMLGKPDQEVKDLFDGGKANKSEDGKILLGRSYSTILEKKEVTLETVYGDNQKVNTVTASFTNQTVDELKKMISNTFGEPKVDDNSQEMEGKRLTWKKDNVSIELNESYGMPIVEFILINQ